MIFRTLSILGLLALPLPLLAQGTARVGPNGLPGVERRIVVAPAETLYVADAGAGDVVVLLPGLLGSAYQYRLIAPRFVAEGFRVLVVEPLGVGRGGRPESADYSLTAQADRVPALLDSLGIGRAFLAAHSTGGSIALRTAYRAPSRVRGVLLLEAGAAEAATTPGFRRALRFDWLIRLFGGMNRIRGEIRGALRDKSANPAWVTDTVVAGYMAGASDDLDATLRGYKSLAAAVEPERLGDNLHRVTAPVLLVLGGYAHDGGPQARELELMRKRLPVFASESLEVSGHFPHEEAPGAVVAAMLRLRAAAACAEAAVAGTAAACFEAGG